MSMDVVLQAIIDLHEKENMHAVSYYEVSKYLHADITEVIFPMLDLARVGAITVDENGVVTEWRENARYFERYLAAGVQVVEI